MTVITNEPVLTLSSGVAILQFRTDTFLVTLPGSAIGFPQHEHSARTFADEKAAFGALFSMLRSRYPGEWVAVSGGQVVDHDADRKAVTQRFFSAPRRGPVYIGFVGATPTLRQTTPFRARRRA